MVKKDLAEALSLSCVENYFLSYFKDHFDIRVLFLKSYEPLYRVMENCFIKGIKYENYPLERLQSVSEKLGLTNHSSCDFFMQKERCLNLIRVNKNFFNNTKIYPWREDHFIAVEKTEKGYKCFNNYPLSEELCSQKEILDVFGGKSISFFNVANFSSETYKELAEWEYNYIFSEQKINKFDFDLKDTVEIEILLKLRDTFLVLKTLRKRIIQWFDFERQLKRVEFDENYNSLSVKIIKLYENIVTDIQLRIIKKKMNTQGINEKISEISDTEKLFFNSIRQGE